MDFSTHFVGKRSGLERCGKKKSMQKRWFCSAFLVDTFMGHKSNLTAKNWAHGQNRPEDRRPLHRGMRRVAAPSHLQPQYYSSPTNRNKMDI